MKKSMSDFWIEEYHEGNNAFPCHFSGALLLKVGTEAEHYEYKGTKDEHGHEVIRVLKYFTIRVSTRLRITELNED